MLGDDRLHNSKDGINGNISQAIFTFSLSGFLFRVLISNSKYNELGDVRREIIVASVKSDDYGTNAVSTGLFKITTTSTLDYSTHHI